MSGASPANREPVTDRRQLVAYLESGCKPPEQWRIGTEHEKFVYRLSDLRPVPYEGPDGIGAFLEGLRRYGWKPVLENGQTIALSHEGCSISLEPGGQLELSGKPLETIHQTCDEVHTHLAQVKAVAEELGVGLIGLGFQPKWRRSDVPWMPKGRYAIMRAYMPTVGSLGLDMMLRTCTVQVNLDFASEADMVRKFRVALALQPVITALFANSPFVEGRPSGYLSLRSHVWTDTDPDRCGILPFVFESGMGFERYVDYALDVPMYFVHREGRYIDVAGQSFRDFMAGRLPGLPGERPTLGDWEDHLTTLFPQVRLKRFLEMRDADGGPWGRLCALPAVWVGLTYDSAVLDQAWDYVRDWTPEEHARLRREVPRDALGTRFRDRSLREVAVDVLTLAREGLRRRARRGVRDVDESPYLDVLDTIAQSGRCPAQELLDAFHGRWRENIDPVFREYAY
ncbi:MAG TPA: glutamate--cysteine ligase [Gammaproteobacteria bacterium]|nr:glutamate--cysteine ligase [Gammaproteobacteria bacterium]